MTENNENDLIEMETGVTGFLSEYPDSDIPVPEEIPDLEDQLEKLISFFDTYDIPFEKIDKKAYPNDSYISIPGQHNLNKWLSALKEIRFADKNGAKRTDTIKNITASWSMMEQVDFLNWIKYYESGNHLKYKVAQVQPFNSPNFFLKVKDEEVPTVSNRDIDFAISDSAKAMSLSEKKQIIERHRSKLISRLDAAEKLLRTSDGEIFAGKDLESLIEAIYSLKKKIHLVNKLSIANNLYEDMIIREGNILTKKGFASAGLFLIKLAEETLTPAEPSDPTLQMGLPSMGPRPAVGEGNNNPDLLKNIVVDEEGEDSGVEGFLNNLDTGNFTEPELLEEDDLNVEDDSLEVEDGSILVTEAQAAPVVPPETKTPAVPVGEPVKVETPDLKKSTVVENDDLTVDENDKPSKNDHVDDLINSVFSNISIEDVIVKLEDLSKIFNTREVPRQLAIVDMMLDSLGIATFFPSLSEATNKAHESNNYISSRIDDVLSKLRGNLPTNEIDLEGSTVSNDPTALAIRNKLKQQTDTEKARKEKRKQKENELLDNEDKESPELNISEDLKSEVVPTPTPVAPAKPAPKVV